MIRQQQRNAALNNVTNSAIFAEEGGFDWLIKRELGLSGGKMESARETAGFKFRDQFRGGEGQRLARRWTSEESSEIG